MKRALSWEVGGAGKHWIVKRLDCVGVGRGVGGWEKFDQTWFTEPFSLSPVMLRVMTQ